MEFPNRARWQSLQRTKLYDFAFALPLIVWYVDRLWDRWPEFQNALFYARYQPELITELRFASEIGTFGFVAAVILMLIIRVPPVAKAPGIAPRIAGLIGTFATLAFIEIEPADIGIAIQITATALIIIGCFFGIYCVFGLGRSFSIMAEARQLRTQGAYAFVRHPLYLAEELIVLGAVLQYRQPWAALIGIVQFGFQLWRIHNEERVLSRTFPEYAAYAAVTSRLIPGLY
jgi:protein-S-isoprenylcysteine O-methyltransferase Ste14